MTPVEALQAWLALEHEAVWLQPLVGARLDALVERATTSYEAHRDTRDEVVARLRTLGAEPVSAALAYSVGPIGTTDEASAAVVSLEARISSATLTLAGISEAALRTFAVAGLRRSALAGQRWGAAPSAFPGLP